MTAALSIAERVAAGAAWLDEHKPGWDHLIDLGRLDMSDSCLCVLGQVYAAAARTFNENADADCEESDDQGFEAGWSDDVTGFDYAIDQMDAPMHSGFCFTWDEIAALRDDDKILAAWSDLGTEWKRLIAARRAGESR